MITSADNDHTVPWPIANASFKKQQHNTDVTEIVKLEGRGHALSIDSGWQEVAQNRSTSCTASRRRSERTHVESADGDDPGSDVT